MNFSRGHDCNGQLYSSSSTAVDEFPSPARFLDFPDLTLTGTNVVAGTNTFDDPGLSPPRHIVFKWRFTLRTTP